MGGEGIFHLMLLEVVGWINLIFWGSAESPGGTALAALCCRARRVVGLGGRHHYRKISYPVHVLGVMGVKQVFHHSLLTISQDWGISHKDHMTNVAVGDPDGLVNLILRSFTVFVEIDFSRENGALFTHFLRKSAA